MSSMLKLCGISKRYCAGNSGSTIALANISLEIGSGESVAIMGASGSGKSTLLQILGCITTADSGEYYIDGKEAKALSDHERARLRNKKFGFVMQNFGLIEYRNVIDNVKIPMQFCREFSEKQRIERCRTTLERVGLSGYERKKTGLLSGGEKQRAAIARAIVNSPSVILADEPTGALDSANRDSIMRLFHEINEGGTTVITVTHDEKLRSEFSRIIRISDGKIIDDREGSL